MKKIFSILLFIVGYTAQAQQDKFTLKGVIVDSISNAPVAKATLILNRVDTSTQKSLLSKADGTFEFGELLGGIYILSISQVGYTPTGLKAKISQNTDLGVILISAQAQQLSSVTVTAAKTVVRQEPDRLVYNLQADPESKGRSVLEMMRKVPMLSIDGRGAIALKGSSAFKVFMDGKPSGMMANDPQDILRSMPASSVQSIEVITSPPSKYDAEGLAGIINIVTTKKIAPGYSGNINIREIFPKHSPSIAGNFTGKTGKLAFRFNSGLNRFRSPGASDVLMRESRGPSPSLLTIDANRMWGHLRKYFQSELSYEIDSLNLISGQFNYNSTLSGINLNSTTVLRSESALIESYKWLLFDSTMTSTKEVVFNYQHGFLNNKNRFLTLSYRFYMNRNDLSIYFTGRDRYNFSQPDYRQQNITKPIENTIQADYVHPLGKLTIEGGVKAIWRDNQSNFDNFIISSSTGKPTLDPSLANYLDNQQKVLAAYNSYKLVFKKWDFRGGVRIEGTVTNAKFISSASEAHQDYFNILPSIALSNKVHDNTTFNFSFNQRIQRPGIQNLNPFVDRSIPGFESSGNPALRPVLSNNIQAGYSRSKKSSINFNIGYMFIKNSIMRLATYDAANSIYRTTFANTGKERRLTANLTVSTPITKKLNVSVNYNPDYLWLEGTVDGNLVSHKGLQFRASSDLGFNSNGWRVNLGFNYYSRGLDLQGVTKEFFAYSMSLNKDIIKNKFSVSANSDSPFNRYRFFGNDLYGNNFTQTMRAKYYYQSYSVSLNYKFGKLKEGIKRSKKSISNDDVVGG